MLNANYRAFRLLGADGPTGPEVLEHFTLADSAGERWQPARRPDKAEARLGERFRGFLQRAPTSWKCSASSPSSSTRRAAARSPAIYCIGPPPS